MSRSQEKLQKVEDEISELLLFSKNALSLSLSLFLSLSFTLSLLTVAQ